MKKYLSGILLSMILSAALFSFNTFASDAGGETLEISEYNQTASVTLGIPQASQEEISSFQLSLNVDAGTADVVFQFNEGIPGKVKEYRYSQDSGVLNLYIAGTEPVFGQSEEKLFLGSILVLDENGAGQPFTVRVPAEALKLPGRSRAEAVSFAESTEVQIGSGGAAGGSTPEGSAGGDSISAGGTAAGEDMSGRQSIELAKEYDKSQYTEKSYGALEEALQNAEKVLKTSQSSEKDKEEALQKLQNAVGSLESNAPTSAQEKHSANKAKSDQAKIKASPPILLYVMCGLLCVLIVMAVLYGIIYRQSLKKRYSHF